MYSAAKMFGIPDMISGTIVDPSCGTPYKEMAAGAAITFVGLDTLLPAPPIVHMGLAGVAAQYMCDGTVDIGLNTATAQSFGFGAAGGIVMLMILGRR